MDLCPRGDSAEPQLCVQSSAQDQAETQGQILILTAPAPKAAAMGESPVPARSEGTRQSGLGDRWAQSSSAPNLDLQPVERCWGIHTLRIHVHQQFLPSLYPAASRAGKCVSQGKYRFHGSPSSMTQLCLKHLAQLTQGTGKRQLGAALPPSKSQHSHQVAHKIFSFFFIEITIKN